jgi:hypothetical protein
MKDMAETSAMAAATQNSSSYRVKFDHPDFIELVQIANPRIIYR